MNNKKLQDELLFKTEQLEAFFTINLDMLCITDFRGNFIRINKAWEKILGYPVIVLEKSNFMDFIHPDDKDATLESMKKLMNNETVIGFVNRYKSIDGSYKYIEWNSVSANNLIYAAARNITARIEMEKNITEQKEQFELAIKGSKDGIWDWNILNNSLFVSERWKNQLGYNSEEIIDNVETITKLIHPDDFSMFNNNLNKYLNKEIQVFDNELRMLHKDGYYCWIKLRGEALWDSNGKPYRMAGSQTDITEEKQAQLTLKLSEEKYRLITENTWDIIWVMDINTMSFTYVSPSVEQVRGFTIEEALKQRWEDVILPQYLKSEKEKMLNEINEFKNNPNVAQEYISEMIQSCKNGNPIWVEVSRKYRYNKINHIEIVGVSRNIDKRKKAEHKVVYLSFHDHLTGLYNRRYYEEELNRINTEPNLPITLVMADVNGLKLANDAFGHIEGDKLLITFADILRKVCRKGDIVSRIGGDEFVILLPQTDILSAERIVSRINQFISETNFDKTNLSVSFGLKTKYKIEEDFNEIYKQAEDAMYRHKLKDSDTYKRDMIKMIIFSLNEKSLSHKEHGINVSELCKKTAQIMGFDSQDVRDIELAGLLHDIGKIGIDEKLINNPNMLNDKEKEELHRHSEIGYQILRSVTDFANIAEYVLAHHERPDGKGYPKGIKDIDIPIQAKIISVADNFDNLVNVDKMTYEKAGEVLKIKAGSEFDEEIVKKFLENILPSYNSN